MKKVLKVTGVILFCLILFVGYKIYTIKSDAKEVAKLYMYLEDERTASVDADNQMGNAFSEYYIERYNKKIDFIIMKYTTGNEYEEDLFFEYLNSEKEELRTKKMESMIEKQDVYKSESSKQITNEVLSTTVESKEKNNCDCKGDGLELENIREIPSNYTGRFFKCYTDTCAIEVIGTCVDGKRHTENDAFEVWYHKNGNVGSKGQLWKGEKMRTWKNYHPNGKLAETGVYVNGDKIDEWVRYYENGQMHERGKYGRINYGTWHVGYWEGWYENGGIMYKGYPEGRIVYYYENGQISDDGGTHGEQTQYYENGQIKSHGFKVPGNKRDGVWEFYDEKGNLTRTQEYHN